MVIHRTFAQIVGTQIKNIIVIDDFFIAQQLTKASFGENSVAVDCSRYPVSVGDYFIDGVFYKADENDKTKQGEVVKRINTADEDAYEANAKATANQRTLADVLVNTEYLMALAEADIDAEIAAAEASETNTTQQPVEAPTETDKEQEGIDYVFI